MLFEGLKDRDVNEIPLRMLAYLGDAVFELFERERELSSSNVSKDSHRKVVARVNAEAQAQLLEAIRTDLTERELDLIRRARNLKASGPRRQNQSLYRRATALEALVGYLYLTDQMRMRELLTEPLAD